MQTWGNLVADVHADHEIVHIAVWGGILGNVSALGQIDEIYVGDGLGPAATVTAPLIGAWHLGDRSPFVDLPGVPHAPLGELSAVTAEAYASLQELHRQLVEAKSEVGRAIAALKTDVAARQIAVGEISSAVHAEPHRPWLHLSAIFQPLAIYSFSNAGFALHLKPLKEQIAAT